MMTSKGPSGIYTQERKGMPGNQGFAVYLEDRKEILSRDREHRRITYGWEKVVARDLFIRKSFSRRVFMRQSLFFFVREEEKEHSKQPHFIPAVDFLFFILICNT